MTPAVSTKESASAPEFKHACCVMPNQQKIHQNLFTAYE